MFAQISGGEVVRTYSNPTTITIDGVTYPRQVFMDKAKLKSFGILPYREVSVDARYQHSGTISYEIKEDEVVGSYASPTDKDVAVLKTGMLDKAKQSASALFVRDDWMAIREAEGGTAMADNVKAFRVAVRKESNDKETAIKSLGDLDAVKLYEATPYIETRKKETTADDGSVSYGDEYESERHLDLVNHYFAEDPLADDPAFVSLVKK